MEKNLNSTSEMTQQDSGYVKFAPYTNLPIHEDGDWSKPTNPDKVTIDIPTYTELLMAELKLDLIKSFVESDKGTYGFTRETSDGICKILGIKKDE